MFKRVDEAGVEKITGYSYKNKDGEIESVKMDGIYPTVDIRDSSGAGVEIYMTDIPHLIKALQAAYDHKEA